MGKSECISIFNSLIKGRVDLQQCTTLISDYLTEIKCNKSRELITLVVQHPQLIQEALPKILNYYCNKYNIFVLKINEKTILYYE